MKYILITGVSSGLGYDAVKYFTSQGFHVFGSVRKEKDRDRLVADFPEHYTPLMFDITNRAEIDREMEVIKSTLKEGENLDALLCNAGIHIPGPGAYLKKEDMRWQFEVNVFGSLSVIQAAVPLLRKTATKKAGRILHVGSTSGRLALPFSSLYAATKSAMHSVFDTLRRELMLYEIDCIDVYVGPVNNDAVERVAVHADKYKHTEYYTAIKNRLEGALKNNIPKGLSGEEVAAFFHKILKKKNPKVRYAYNKQWFMTWTLPINLPHRLLDRLVAKRMGLIK